MYFLMCQYSEVSFIFNFCLDFFVYSVKSSICIKIYMGTLSNDTAPNKVSFSGPSLGSVTFREEIGGNQRSSYAQSVP